MGRIRAYHPRMNAREAWAAIGAVVLAAGLTACSGASSPGSSNSATRPTPTVRATHAAATHATSAGPSCFDHITDLAVLTVAPDGSWNTQVVGADQGKPPHCVRDTATWLHGVQSAGSCMTVGLASDNQKIVGDKHGSAKTRPTITRPVASYGC